MTRGRTRSPKPAAPVQLPEGVTLADWALEQSRWQNPRIRGFLGCIRVLDEVFESNFAILNCSPRRLQVIWTQVRKVAAEIRNGIAPLLRRPSVIPELEEARGTSEEYLDILDERLLSQLDTFPDEVPEDREAELRRLLCVAMGQIHAFLLDTLGGFLAADPRSQHDSDYFLERRFARDVDEAEWLLDSVVALERYLERLLERRRRELAAAAAAIVATGRVPSDLEWRPVADLIHELVTELTPQLTKIVGLRGIRLSELDLLDASTKQIPAACSALLELYEVSREVDERLAAATDRTAVDPVLSARLSRRLRSIESQLIDLAAFVSVWRAHIGNRRALMLRRGEAG